MNTLRTFTFGLMAVLLLGSAALAQSNPAGGKDGMVFKVMDPVGRNSVTFRSTAPLEDIVGTTSDITGLLVFDPKNPQQGGHGELTVPVSSLNTGIPLRDEHLKSAGWLNAEKYPEIKLAITSLKNIKEVKTTQDAMTYDITIVGNFSLHGKTEQIEFPGRITYLKESKATQQRLPGNLLAARAGFDVKLKDYGITGPEGTDLIGSKVGETISIEVSLMGNSQEADMVGKPNTK
jgi:polyisoprenoid-binding protein YceI